MKFKQYLKEEKGSFLDNKKMPKEGQMVYAIVGFDQKIVKGKVIKLTNIDNKGLANTYLDIDVNGKNYHLDISQIYDHMPKKVKTKDVYGETMVWEMSNEMGLESGYTITKNSLRNLKKDVKTVDEFIQRIKKKTKLSSSEENGLRRTYEEL